MKNVFFFNSDFASNEKFVHCPYNPVHTMPYKTLVLHLAKCPDKSKPSSKRFKNCMYNDLHVVHENELEVNITRRFYTRF